MNKQILRIATRNSQLALWQAEHIRDQLYIHWPNLEVQIHAMTTSGDKFLNNSLIAIGGKGLFVKELEESLLNKSTDIAVHSMKDVPTTLPNGLILNTICQRANPFDAFVSNDYQSLKDLPINSKIGTSSLRRQSQLLAFRPDLNIHPVRGNIQTRIKKMSEEKLSGIILAHAGLERMGLSNLIKETISSDIMLPSCGQGALGIECRENDFIAQTLLKPLSHQDTTICVQSERMVNELLGGNCHVPLSVYAYISNQDHISIEVKVALPNGCEVIYQKESGYKKDALNISKICAEKILNKGAKELLSQKF